MPTGVQSCLLQAQTASSFTYSYTQKSKMIPKINKKNSAQLSNSQTIGKLKKEGWWFESQRPSLRSHSNNRCQIWHFNLLRNNLEFPLQEEEWACSSFLRRVFVHVEGKGCDDRESKAWWDAVYSEQPWVKGSIMHTERVSFINYPTSRSRSFVCTLSCMLSFSAAADVAAWMNMCFVNLFQEIIKYSPSKAIF